VKVTGSRRVPVVGEAVRPSHREDEVPYGGQHRGSAPVAAVGGGQELKHFGVHALQVFLLFLQGSLQRHALGVERRQGLALADLVLLQGPLALAYLLSQPLYLVEDVQVALADVGEEIVPAEQVVKAVGVQEHLERVYLAGHVHGAQAVVHDGAGALVVVLGLLQLLTVGLR
jgi:hypothetical protein